MTSREEDEGEMEEDVEKPKESKGITRQMKNLTFTTNTCVIWGSVLWVF